MASPETVAQVFGREPVFVREGGSIGAVAMLQQICGVESVLVDGSAMAMNLSGGTAPRTGWFQRTSASKPEISSPAAWTIG